MRGRSAAPRLLRGARATSGFMNPEGATMTSGSWGACRRTVGRAVAISIVHRPPGRGGDGHGRAELEGRIGRGEGRHAQHRPRAAMVAVRRRMVARRAAIHAARRHPHPHHRGGRHVRGLRSYRRARGRRSRTYGRRGEQTHDREDRQASGYEGNDVHEADIARMSIDAKGTWAPARAIALQRGVMRLDK